MFTSVRFRSWLGAALLTLAPGVPAAPWPGPPDPAPAPSEAAVKRLRAGDIIVQQTRRDERGGAALAQAVFHVEAETLWAIIGDCEANRRFVRGLESCTLLENQVNRALTRQRLKPFALLPAFDYVFETVRAPFEWMRIRLVEGELDVLEGSWRFEPLVESKGLLVTHEIQIRPGLPVPSWLARRAVRQDLGDLMACLRWVAKAWPDPRRRGLDRQACPEAERDSLDPLGRETG